MADIKELINLVVDGKDLSEDQAAQAMEILMGGEATPAQAAAFLVGLRAKGETVAEITGCARVMRQKATPVPTQRDLVVDTCGTGGDGKGSFNISTTAAFVVAGAGLPVAKHGNRAASSRSGSADVLEALGVNIALTPAQVGRCIDEVGFGFLFAPALHAAMKHVAPVRRELGIRTIFNVLGPLTNPAGARAQVMGVFTPALTEPLAGVLQRLGSRRALVVHGMDGLDEISIAGSTRISECSAGGVATYDFAPEEVGLKRAPHEAVLGGTPAENAAITRAVLAGEPGPRRDVVVLNAAAALVAGGAAANMGEGARLAEQTIDSGRARAALEQLIALSNKLAS